MLDNEDEGVGPIDTKGRATEGALGDLHGVVAAFLTLKIQTGKATAAELGAAIAFLKNNSITASPEQNTALSNLSQVLQERKAKGKVSAASMKDAEDSFAALMGGTPGLQ